MEIIYLIVGVVFGVLVGFVFMRSSLKTRLLQASSHKENELSTLKEEKNDIDRKNAVLETSLTEKQLLLAETGEKLKIETELRQKAEMESAIAISDKLKLDEDLKKVSTTSALFESKFNEERNTRFETEKQYAKLVDQKDSLMEKLENERKQLSEIQEKFTDEFENLAHKILKQNTQDFNVASTKNIGELLNPLKERLQNFEKKVGDTYEKGLKDQSDLKAELKKLHDLSLRLDQDARNLTNALKADTKKQGNWGEIILERVLERSGLIKDQEYFVQLTARNEDGDMLRPDVVIKLPDNKHIIIDSKVSLTAYTQYVSEEDDKKRDVALKMHLTSVKKHVKELSSKSYSSLPEFNSPDFVLMFMPIEPAFALAVQADPDMFNYAWKERVVIVSPTTLLATLRTVASIWKYEKQNQNALEIAERGAKLYDKFVSFIKDLEGVGLNLQRAGKSYEEAHKKLTSGGGNILRQVEQLKKMGVSPKNSLPEQYLIDNE